MPEFDIGLEFDIALNVVLLEFDIGLEFDKFDIGLELVLNAKLDKPVFDLRCISKKYFLRPMPQTHKTLGQKSKRPNARFRLTPDVLSRLVLDTMCPIADILSSTSCSRFVLDYAA